MLKGFVFNFKNIARLITLVRSERGRRTCHSEAAARCYTRDVSYWEMEECGAQDRIRVNNRKDLAEAFRRSDRNAYLVQLTVLELTWQGDEVTSRWRAKVRSPGTGAPYFKMGFSRARFRGFLIAEMVTILTSVEEPVHLDA